MTPGDSFAVRLASLSGRARNGATSTVGGVTYTGDGSRVGGTDVFTTRAKLLWQPNDSFKANFTYELLNDRSQAPGAVNVTPSLINPATGGQYYDFQLLGLPGYTGNNPLGNAGVDNRQGYLIDMQNGHRGDANRHLRAARLHLVLGYRLGRPAGLTGVRLTVSIICIMRL